MNKEMYLYEFAKYVIGDQINYIWDMLKNRPRLLQELITIQPSYVIYSMCSIAKFVDKNMALRNRYINDIIKEMNLIENNNGHNSTNKNNVYLLKNQNPLGK